MININRWTRGKIIIPKKLEFAGGYPRRFLFPHYVIWSNNLSLFWLGTELVWFRGVYAKVH